MTIPQKQYNTRELIAKNILHLLSISGLSRKEFASKIDVPYTTLCDWVGAKSYPRIEALEKIASCFDLQVGDFFIEIEHNTSVEGRLLEYVRRMSMNKDYTYTYPEGFFDLFGAITDDSFVIPEDLPAEEEAI